MRLGAEGELGVASSLGALSVILLCTNQECRGEAGGGFRGKEPSFSLLLRHLRKNTQTTNNITNCLFYNELLN